MTRQQEKVVLQRLETIRQHKMAELHREKSERRRNVRGANARLVAAMDKTAKLKDKVLETLRTALEKYTKERQELTDMLHARVAVVEQYAADLKLRLCAGTWEDAAAELNEFRAKKF